MYLIFFIYDKNVKPEDINLPLCAEAGFANLISVASAEFHRKIFTY